MVMVGEGGGTEGEAWEPLRKSFKAAARRKTRTVILSFAVKRDMHPFEYRSVRYWSKETDWTLSGGLKNSFLDSRC